MWPPRHDGAVLADTTEFSGFVTGHLPSLQS